MERRRAGCSAFVSCGLSGVSCLGHAYGLWGPQRPRMTWAVPAALVGALCSPLSSPAMANGGVPKELVHGVGLNLIGTSDGGEPFRYFWKAFRPSSEASGDSLRWELKKVILAGGCSEAKTMKPWRHVSQIWSKWQAQVASRVLNAGACMSPARHALRKRPHIDTELLARAEQEPFLDTAALLALLLTWPQHRRQVGVQAKVLVVGKLLFCLTLEPQGVAAMAICGSNPSGVW